VTVPERTAFDLARLLPRVDAVISLDALLKQRKAYLPSVDYAYPEYKIAIEYDGDHHRDRATFRFDMERQNELHVLGWTVLRFNADDVLRRPEQTAAMIRVVLRQAGWPGL
jgi:very-short-patch-repair endonuclease